MKTTDAASFQAAELEEITARAKRAADGYAGDVLRSDLLSVGLYVVPAGGVDDQTPHTEEEVYYTVSGRAMFRVGERDHPVQPGSLLFVPAGVAHFFHDVSEELVLVVFWAPPEGSVAGENKEEP